MLRVENASLELLQVDQKLVCPLHVELACSAGRSPHDLSYRLIGGAHTSPLADAPVWMARSTSGEARDGAADDTHRLSLPCIAPLSGAHADSRVLPEIADEVFIAELVESFIIGHRLDAFAELLQRLLGKPGGKSLHQKNAERRSHLVPQAPEPHSHAR